jgi:hypothetical protein
MRDKRWIWALAAVVALVLLGNFIAGGGAGTELRNWLLEMHGLRPHSGEATAPQWTDAASHSTTIPIEVANDNVYLRVEVKDGTPPLSFLLDTGDKYAVLDLARARQLGFDLSGDVVVRGGGENSVHGSFLRRARFRVSGLRRFSQALALAVPLGEVARRKGHAIDGILGSDFIRRFVVEIDYGKRQLTFRDRRFFSYGGAGKSLPITFDAEDHPRVRAQLIVGGHPLPEGDFVLDLGASRAVILNTPFVQSEPALAHLPTAQSTSARPAAAGIGGAVRGRDVRVEALRLGEWLLRQPVVLLVEDSRAAAAEASVQGTIGGEALRRFVVILDYGQRRVILEPTGRLAEPFE